MADVRSALMQSLFQGITEPAPQEEDSQFAPLLDPDVKKRLKIDAKTGTAKLQVSMPKRASQISPMAATPMWNGIMPGAGTSNTPEERARTQEAYVQFKDLLAQQEQGIEKQNQTVADMKAQNKEAQYNDVATAAAGLGDAVYGGNQEASAKSWAGPSSEDRAKVLQDVEDKINSQRSDMSKQVAGLISEQNNMKIADMAAKNSRQLQGQDFRLNQGFMRDVQAANKNGFEVLSQVTPIESALQEDANGNVDFGRVRLATSNAARSMGEKGPLTEGDIERVVQRSLSTEIARVEAFLDSNPNKPVPASVVAPLKAAIADGKRSMQKIMDMKLKGLSDSYQAMGLRPEIAQGVVGNVYSPMFNQSFATQPAAAPAPSGGKKMMSPQEWLADQKAKGLR